MNAKKEFIGHVEGKIIKCACVYFEDVWEESVSAVISLRIGWSSGDMEAFLQSIDREYDNGYGAQYFFGTIWYMDGTWSDRFEREGKEWWRYYYCPIIPSECALI